MRVERAELDRLSGDHGFLPATLEKVLRLGEVLIEFGRQPLLRDALLLKGGTVLNLCADAPPRLSVDLDFNYVRAEEREAMLSDRREIESVIARIAPTFWTRLTAQCSATGSRTWTGTRSMCPEPSGSSPTRSTSPSGSRGSGPRTEETLGIGQEGLIVRLVRLKEGRRG